MLSNALTGYTRGCGNRKCHSFKLFHPSTEPDELKYSSLVKKYEDSTCPTRGKKTKAFINMVSKTRKHVF